MKQETKFKDTEIGMIPDDWEIDTLGNHTNLIKGISYRSEDYCSEEDGLIFINLKCVRRNGGFRKEGIKYYNGGITEEQFVKPGEILIANTDITQNREVIGSPVKVPDLKNDRQMCISLDLSKLDVTSKNLDSNFLYYYLMSPRARHFMISNGNGTTVVHLSTKNVPNMIIPLPNMREQTAIAKILSDLDSKIELLQKQNKTLEAIGQAIFKHRFVDFEFPDEEGKPYKSSGGEMVDSEFGEIPRGWGVGTLGDICEITMGQSPPGKTYNEIGKGTPFYQGNRDFGFRFPTRRVYCTAPTRFAEEGNVLLSVRAPVGNLNVAEERCAIGRGVAALRLNGTQHGYLYYLLRATQSGWNEFEAEGTVFGSANKSDVQGFKVVIPPNKSKEQFASLIKSLDDQIINNEKQSRALISIRDTLLPKLMSGELRVSATGKLPEVIE